MDNEKKTDMDAFYADMKKIATEHDVNLVIPTRMGIDSIEASDMVAIVGPAHRVGIGTTSLIYEQLKARGPDGDFKLAVNLESDDLDPKHILNCAIGPMAPVTMKEQAYGRLGYMKPKECFSDFDDVPEQEATENLAEHDPRPVPSNLLMKLMGRMDPVKIKPDPRWEGW